MSYIPRNYPGPGLQMFPRAWGIFCCKFCKLYKPRTAKNQHVCEKRECQRADAKERSKAAYELQKKRRKT